jgi:geranylgeranyl reductase family protein
MDLFDVMIVGGGPGGSTAALFAREAGLRTLLVEKEIFPRDKVCGDAISGKSINILRKLQLLDKVENIPQIRANGVIFSSPRGDEVVIKFRSVIPGEPLQGYVSKRIDFDNFLFQKAKSQVTLCLENFQITKLIDTNDGLCGIQGKFNGSNKEHEFYGKIIIGADGYKSFISQKLGLYHYDSKHTLVALRAYYRGIKNMNEFIEIHFIKESLPGYFWIFPLVNGMANVGIGMRHQDIKKKNIDLLKVLENAIHSPKFSERFANAELIDKIKGWNLPTGGVFRPNHAAGVLLVGDAAGLVDPFTGEGIGNAMTSAHIAVDVAAMAITEGNTSKTRLSEYDRLLKKELSSELTLSYRLQKIGTRYPYLLNMVIGKAAKSQKVAEWISSMIADESSKKDLTSPLTYLKLLWG